MRQCVAIGLTDTSSATWRQASEDKLLLRDSLSVFYLTPNYGRKKRERWNRDFLIPPRTRKPRIVFARNMSDASSQVGYDCLDGPSDSPLAVFNMSLLCLWFFFAAFFLVVCWFFQHLARREK
jgi:hypothetical protein